VIINKPNRLKYRFVFVRTSILSEQRLTV